MTDKQELEQLKKEIAYLALDLVRFAVDKGKTDYSSIIRICDSIIRKAQYCEYLERKKDTNAMNMRI